MPIGTTGNNVHVGFAIPSARIANKIQIMAGDSSPESTPVAAEIGSLFMQTNGIGWIKTLSADNGWEEISTVDDVYVFSAHTLTSSENINTTTPEILKFSTGANFGDGNVATLDVATGIMTIVTAGHYQIKAYGYGISQKNKNVELFLEVYINGLPKGITGASAHGVTAGDVISLKLNREYSFGAGDEVTLTCVRNGMSGSVLSEPDSFIFKLEKIL